MSALLPSVMDYYIDIEMISSLMNCMCNLMVVSFFFLPLICRLFVLKMSWRGTLPSSLGMPMQRYTNVMMIDVLDLCATSECCIYGLWLLIAFHHGVNMKIDVCRAYGSGKEDSPACDVPGFESSKMKLLRHVSFVDCPVSE